MKTIDTNSLIIDMDKETEKENMAMGGEAPALQGGREGAFGRRGETVRAGAGETPGGWQGIESGGVPAAFGPAGPSAVQTVAEAPCDELECRAACLAARDLARHYCELAGEHERLALAAKAGVYGLAVHIRPACAGLLRLADESTAGELRRRIRWLGVQMAMLAVLQGLTVVYVLWRFSVR